MNDTLMSSQCHKQSLRSSITNYFVLNLLITYMHTYIIGTNENVVYFWGTRYVSPYTRPSTREVFSQSFGSRMATPSDAPLSESDVHTMMHLESMRKEMSSGFHQQLVLDTNQMEEYEKTLATLSSSALLKHQSDITLKDVVTDPQEILALFASQKQQEKGKVLYIT